MWSFNFPNTVLFVMNSGRQSECSLLDYLWGGWGVYLFIGGGPRALVEYEVFAKGNGEPGQNIGV